MAVNMTKAVSDRLARAHDTLHYCEQALSEIDRMKGELRLHAELMDPLEKIQFEERMANRLKRLNESLRVSLAFCYHIN